MAGKSKKSTDVVPAAYVELRPQLKTGDVVLFSGKGGVSEWIKWFTGSKWSHVGMVMVLESYDSVLLWESTTLGDLPDVESGKSHRGVQLVGLRERIAGYGGEEVSVRQLNKALDAGQLKSLGDFRSEVSGRPYEKNKIELLRAAADLFPFDRNKENLSSLFCSELVAESFQRVGLLPDGGKAKPSNEYTPEDFSSKADTELKLLKGFTLRPEVRIR